MKFAIYLSSIFILLGISVKSQSVIEPKEGFTPQIGILVAMLEDLKMRVTYNVQNLTQEETDFLMDEDANRMGALIMHLAATEKYYQNLTFENRGFNPEERKQGFQKASDLGKSARKEFKDKPMDYYLKIWDEVRAETLAMLKTKDDEWLNAKVGESQMNNFYAWYHVMEHQANHMGQIALIVKRLPKRR